MYELLAIEQDRKNKANESLGEAKKIFTKNDPYFDGMVKKYVAIEDDAEQIPDETKEMVKTVKQQLEELQESVAAALDATLSKEETQWQSKGICFLQKQFFGLQEDTSIVLLPNWKRHWIQAPRITGSSPVKTSGGGKVRFTTHFFINIL